MGTRRLVHLTVFVVGFCGIVAQVLALREMVVTFYGNELSVGVMLASWLVWTGLGSLVLGRLARRLGRPGMWLAAALVLAALLLLFTVVGARLLNEVLREVEGGSIGQVRPFGTMLVSSLALLAPFCLVNGFLFPLACRAAEEAGGSVGSAYLFEAAGAATGGAVYTFALAGRCDPTILACGLACASCASAAAVAWGELRRGGKVAVGLICLSTVLAVPAALAAVYGRDLRVVLRGEVPRWDSLVLVDTADSRYGRIAVTRQSMQSAQRTLYADGVVAFSYPDPPVAEGVAHLPLLEHPEPRRVLLLGGGPGAVEEVLKHPPVERLTYVELDPLAVAMVRRHFPPAAAKALDDGRVEVVLADGRAFVKGTPQRFDVVISAVGPPTTAQTNRFYTVEFFREVARVLRPGGVVAFRAPGGHNYIPEETQRLLACLRRTVASVFPAVVVFAGPECTFLASDREGRVSYRLGVLQERLVSRGVATSHVDASVWEAELSGGRLEELERALSAEPLPAANRDLSPRCYYYEAQRWSALQRARQAEAGPSWLDLGRLLAFLERRPAAAPLALLGVVAALSLAAPLARRRWRDGALAFSVASTGVIEMGVEFAVLLGFQVACGYLYHYVGVVVAAFMLGLAAGAWASARWVRRGAASWARLLWVQACICAYPLLLLGFLALSVRVRFGAAPALAGVSFGLVALTAGVVGGLQFPLAAALHSRGSGSAGFLYGLDLFGACLGALAVSSVLVPVFGLSAVCLLLVGLAGLGLAGLVAAGCRPGAAKSS